MAKFRKKPIVIDAVQFDGNNTQEIKEWSEGAVFTNPQVLGSIYVRTLEGEMQARRGDWIIKGVNGEFYPCKPDIFEKTYELASKTCPECEAAFVPVRSDQVYDKRLCAAKVGERRRRAERNAKPPAVLAGEGR